MNTTMYLIIGGIVFMLIILAITFFITLMPTNVSKVESMRSAQLETQKKKKTEEENDRQVRQIVMKITDPVIDKILNNKQPKNQKKLQRMLKIAGWDKYFTPIQ